MKISKAVMTLLLCSLIVSSAHGEEEALSPVRLNQVGYRPQDPEIICIVDAQGIFEVLRCLDAQVVFTGEIGAPKQDNASGETIGYANLTALEEPGVYFVRTDIGDSAPFRIAEDVYREAADAALRFFTLQRCGQALSEAEAGKFAHDECHTDDATVYGTDIKKQVRGGWHDAGDYGRYVSAAGKAVMDLLLTQRDFPQVFGDALLEEIRYELDWLLRMQDPETGGVYHKVTSMAFPPLATPPDKDTMPMFLSPVSSTATGDFSGVCAYASLFFQETDPDYARTLLHAAEHAYRWLMANPEVSGFKNPGGITTGEYGDEDDSDERSFASAALYLASGKPEYQEALRPLLGKSEGIGWADMGLYSVVLYLQLPDESRDEILYAKARSILINKAKQLARIAGNEGFRVALRRDEYIWGSNMVVASHGMVLLLAYQYEPTALFVRIAQDQLHYLLGQNANDLSFVTHFGARNPQKPHHRPSVRARGAMPGMLVGGPNSGLQDRTDYRRLSQLPPARQYNDDWGAYASNEVTVYWNSPLVYLLAAFQ